jgi:hypothetical protein
MERRGQHGVYCIFTSMEMGGTFTSKLPKFPIDDPDYRIIRRVPSRFTFVLVGIGLSANPYADVPVV